MNSEMDDDNMAIRTCRISFTGLSLLFSPSCLPLTPCLPLLWTWLVPASLFSWRRESSPCRVGDRGSAAETDIIPFREEVFPSRYLHPLSLSLSRSPSLSLSPLSHPNLATHSLCTVVYSSYLSLPCSSYPLFHLLPHIATIFQSHHT